MWDILLPTPLPYFFDYEQDPSQYFNDSNLTLLFLPGKHTFNATLIIANIHRLELLGNSSAVAPTKVLMQLLCWVHLQFKHISKVKLDGLAFAYCVRAHVVQVSDGDGSFTIYYGSYLSQTPRVVDCIFQDS